MTDPHTSLQYLDLFNVVPFCSHVLHKLGEWLCFRFCWRKNINDNLTKAAAAFDSAVLFDEIGGEHITRTNLKSFLDQNAQLATKTLEKLAGCSSRLSCRWYVSPASSCCHVFWLEAKVLETWKLYRIKIQLSSISVFVYEKSLNMDKMRYIYIYIYI